MIGHILGSHWYHWWAPRSSNRPIVTISLDPTCQSWPQRSQNGQIVKNHNFMCKMSFFHLTTHVLIKKCKKWFAPAFYRVKTPFFGQKCPYFGHKKAFLSNFWHWTPKILQYVHKFCWCMGFQVKIFIGFDGEGFWVQKKLSRAIWKSLFLPEIQVLKLFWPSWPFFHQSYPQIRTGHVVGLHRQLYSVPGPLNMHIATIFLDSTCQN